MTISKDRRNFYILTESQRKRERENGNTCEECHKRPREYGWDYTTFRSPNHLSCLWLCKKCVKKRFRRVLKRGCI